VQHRHGDDPVDRDRLVRSGDQVQPRATLDTRGDARDQPDTSRRERARERSRSFPGLIFVGTRYAGRAEERIALRALGSGLITRYIEAPTLTVDRNNDAYFVIDEALRTQVDVLKLLVWFYVIDRPSLAILQAGQRKVIRALYRNYERAALKRHDRLFPVLYRERLRNAPTDDAKRRIVVDLVSSLTESSAVEIFRRLGGAASGSVADATGRVV
jgi:dGTPase